MSHPSPHDSAVELADALARAGLAGYDPYDALASPFFRALDRVHPLLGRIGIHGLKSLFFNPRPLLGIRRWPDAKALGLAGRGYLRLGAALRRPDYLAMADRCLKGIRDSISPGFQGACWGHPFPYRSSRAYLPKDFPTVVSTVYAAQALLDAFEFHGEEHWLMLARSACNFVVKDLPRFGTPECFCFGYYPGATARVHNANLLGAQLLVRVGRLANEEQLIEESRGAVRYTLNDQRLDGSWFYDGPESPSRSRSFIDGYHTGFVLESLFDIWRDTGWKEIETPLKKGFAFYVERLFGEDGRPVQRLGVRTPADLRDCAQALIVFARMRSQLPSDRITLPKLVFRWTCGEMRMSSGFYRCTAGPHWSPAVAYTRFQAWMVRALADHLEAGSP